MYFILVYVHAIFIYIEMQARGIAIAISILFVIELVFWKFLNNITWIFVIHF